MIDLKSETKTAFMDGGSRKILTITFHDAAYDGKDEEGKDKYKDYVITNDKIASGSLSIKQSIQSGNQLDFVGCLSSTAEFEMARPPYILKDKEVEIKVSIEGIDEEIILFTGKVDKVKKDSDNALVQSVFCYDKMHELLDEKDVTEWYDKLGDFTMTVKQFRTKLFEHLEMKEVEKGLPRDSMIIKKTIDTTESTDDDGKTVRQSQITAATLIEAICQINGVFGKITNDGKMDYIILNTDSDPFIYDNSMIIKTKHEDSELKKITSVVLYDGSSEEYKSTGEAIAYYPEDKKLVDGDDAVPYEITDNFILYAVNQADALAIAKDLYDKISKVSYTPCTISALGMPWIECGDTIGFYANDADTLLPDPGLYPEDTLFPSGYQLIKTVVMTRTLSGTKLFKDSIEAEGEDIDSSITTINEVITAERFYRKIGEDKLYSEIEQTKSLIQMSIYDEDSGVMSQIKQQANRIDMVVERTEFDHSAITTRLEMTESELALHAKEISMEAEQMKIVSQKVVEFDTQMIDFNTKIANFNDTKVSIVDLASGGKTVINGANITTGVLSCSRIGFGEVELDGKSYDVDWTRVNNPTYESIKADIYEGFLVDKIDVSTTPITIDTVDPNTGIHMEKTINVVTGIDIKYATTSHKQFVAIPPDYPGGPNNDVYIIYNCAEKQSIVLGFDDIKTVTNEEETSK